MADCLPVLHQASVGPGLLVRDPGACHRQPLDQTGLVVSQDRDPFVGDRTGNGKAGAVEHQEVDPDREEYVERCGRWLAKVCGNVEIGIRALGAPSAAAEGQGEARAGVAEGSDHLRRNFDDASHGVIVPRDRSGGLDVQPPNPRSSRLIASLSTSGFLQNAHRTYGPPTDGSSHRP